MPRNTLHYLHASTFSRRKESSKGACLAGFHSEMAFHLAVEGVGVGGWKGRRGRVQRYGAERCWGRRVGVGTFCPGSTGLQARDNLTAKQVW